MSYACLVLGESGSGKTCSLRNFDPTKCLLIQPLRKPLPFRNNGWKEKTRENPNGNVYVTSNPSTFSPLCVERTQTSSSLTTGSTFSLINLWRVVMKSRSINLRTSAA